MILGIRNLKGDYVFLSNNKIVSDIHLATDFSEEGLLDFEKSNLAKFGNWRLFVVAPIDGCIISLDSLSNSCSIIRGNMRIRQSVANHDRILHMAPEPTEVDYARLWF